MKILVVDDTPEDRILLETLLKSRGYRVDMAENGEEALRKLRADPFDAIVSDILMPGMDGFQFCNKVKEDERLRDLPFIFCSASYVDEEDKQLAFKMGADAFILKPVEPSEFMRVFEGVIGDHRAPKAESGRPSAANGKEIFKLYNERLVNKLEKTVLSLDSEMVKRKQSEQALQESEEQYRLLVETSRNAICVVQDDMLAFVNPRLEEMSGYSIEELTGMPISELIYPKDRDMVIEKHRKRLAGENIPPSYSFRIIRKNGDSLWVQINGARLIWGRKPATLIFLQDISHERQLEIQLRRSQKMEAMGTLAGGIAHDFNNILSIILGYSDLLPRDVSNPERVKADVKEIRTAVGRAKDLINQILIFARQEEQDFGSIQPKLIVAEVLKMLRASLPSTIEIHQNLAKDVSTIGGDPTRVHQVLMNLCTNASHAMQEGGGILTVDLTNVKLDHDVIDRYPGLAPGPYVKLSVADTGPGMDRKTLERIFDPYFTTKERGTGTGLGLPIIDGIMRRHGGAVTVYSEPGIGSTFNAYFPVAGDEVKKKTAEDGKGAIEGKERILLVDDEALLVELGKRGLQHFGYDVTAVKGGKEALELFKAEPDGFDLVVTDMTMPEMTGDKLAEELMTLRPDLPVVLCTGFSELVSEKKAMEMGIRAFVMKPLGIQELAGTIRKVLDGG